MLRGSASIFGDLFCDVDFSQGAVNPQRNVGGFLVMFARNLSTCVGSALIFGYILMRC